MVKTLFFSNQSVDVGCRGMVVEWVAHYIGASWSGTSPTIYKILDVMPKS